MSAKHAGKTEERSMGDTCKKQFTQWRRRMDSPQFDLWIQVGNRVEESVTLDIRDLPNRPELLDRLWPNLMERMLWEAREVAKGNLSLDQEFPGYQPM